jgi:hypothetical protein
VIWTWSSVTGGCCGCCPAHYRDNWEQDMVAALLESSPTDDPEEDDYIIEFGEPKWPEIASVAGLAARLYLGGAGAPHRYFAPAAANYDAPGSLTRGTKDTRFSACTRGRWRPVGRAGLPLRFADGTSLEFVRGCRSRAGGRWRRRWTAGRRGRS